MTIALYELEGAKGERFSPYCWRVRFALAHKRLPFDLRGLGFTDIPEAVGAPHRTVPIIDDGGIILSDSWVIADYLDRTYPERPLFGPDGRDKAAHKFIEAWTNQMLTPPMVPLLVLDIHGRLHEKDKPYFRETREKRVGSLEQAASDTEIKIAAFRKLLAPFHYALEQRRWLGGETPNYADYILAGTLQWARVTSALQLVAPEDPVSEWFERCLDLFDGLGRTMPAAA